MNIFQDIETAAQQLSPRTERLFISLGGISCAVISQDCEFLNSLQEYFGYTEPAGKGDYEIILILAPVQDFVSDDSLQTHYPSIKRMKSGNDFILRQGNNPFLAIVNTLSRKVLVKMPRNVKSFGNFLRVLLTLILADEQALLIKASVVSENGQGWAFFGPSGSGKSTIARLSQGYNIIADELAIIKPHNGRFRVYGTPFWDEFFNQGKENARAELSDLYLLKKDQAPRLEAIDSRQAALEIYRNVLFFGDDGKLLNQVFRACCSLADTVPVYRLFFREEPSFWELVRKSA